MKVENAAIDVFIDDIIAVYEKHNLAISHEDCHGSFVIEEICDYDLKWLRAASDGTDGTKVGAQSIEKRVAGIREALNDPAWAASRNTVGRLCDVVEAAHAFAKAHRNNSDLDELEESLDLLKMDQS